jgi:hypothetical protein
MISASRKKKHRTPFKGSGMGHDPEALESLMIMMMMMMMMMMLVLFLCLFALIYRFIRAIEEAFSPLLAAYFLTLMCCLCFAAYTIVLVIV